MIISHDSTSTPNHDITSDTKGSSRVHHMNSDRFVLQAASTKSPAMSNTSSRDDFSTQFTFRFSPDTTVAPSGHMAVTVHFTGALLSVSRYWTSSDCYLFTASLSQQSFLPPTCSNATTVGYNCSISSTACDSLQPCQNHGNCTNINTTSSGFDCSCPTGFFGTYCQLDHRPCQTGTCWNNGTCTQASQTTANCACASGWQGTRCQTKVNYCANVTCLNNGVCRGSLRKYTCECLGDSFSGSHCEITASGTIIHQTVARSFAYVAIIALCTVMVFVVVLDVLKYCFGIGPVEKDTERKPKRRRTSHTAIRFIYVNPTSLPRSTIST